MNVSLKADTASFDALERMLADRARAAMKQAATDSTNDMYEQAVKAVERFYDSYEPTQYKRHFQMRKTPHRHVQERRGVFNGWVQLDPSSLYDIYHDSKEYVFAGFAEGRHGATDIWTEPSPEEMLQHAFDSVVAYAKSYIKF